MIVAFVNPRSTLLHAEAGSETDRRSTGLNTLLRQADLIPVTDLDEEGLLAVPAAFTSWQVLLRGAVVIGPDGLEDEGWRRLSLEAQRRSEQAVTLAHQAARHVDQLGQLGLDVTLVSRSGAPLMVRISHPHGLELALRQAATALREWLADGPLSSALTLEVTPDTVTVLPRDIRVEGAVNYVLGQLSGVTLTVGVSAEHSDRAFMALCDYALLPGDSQLLEQTTQADEPDDLD
ncbi:hypothetical protein [Deinococcus knuensis]|uniref:GspL cytoplasmic actin-ATPase-like domain-containing protein n=1 Tax=Deinococcus knuensis TaxID=1837380 RepID=A0ABQ2SG09_9DEIO|nr:hypothetical protein [Deinococcus knuensis]GGS22094.1 hypothetical protein GCM10008961_11960 [Deinococcus knuensis]